MDTSKREQLIADHLEAIRVLQAEAPAAASAEKGWPPQGYYLLYHVVIGVVLGTIGASVALLCNVAGAYLFDKHPLELIRVFLTFPMGEAALASSGADAKVLTVGCILFLSTGALHGIVFHLVMSTFFRSASVGAKFVISTVMGLVLWVASFYLVLSWLQPLLLGGNWIISEIPFWVAALTHVAFAWTMFVCEILGRFGERGYQTAAAE